MIKYGVILSLFFLVFVKVNAGPHPVRKGLLQFYKAAVKDCYEDEAKTIKVEVDDASFEALITSDPNPPRNTKCIRFCVMKAHELFNEDFETFNSEKIQELFKKVHLPMNDENVKSIADASKSCMALDVKDRCEKAHELAMCMISKLT